MANKKISQFEQQLILDGSEVLPIVKDGVNKKVSISQIVDKVDSYTQSESDTLLGGKVDKVTGSSLVDDTKVTNYDNHLVNTSNPHGVTASQVGAYSTSESDDLFDTKVDKVSGKGLSTNDLTNELLTLLNTKKVKNVTTDAVNNRLVITYTDDTTSSLNLADNITDVYVSGASLDATSNVLTLTSSNGGADVTVDLSEFVNSSEFNGAITPITTDIATIEASKLDTAIIHSATSKTTPADNDEFAILDSATTFSLKKLTFANLKATLLSYFDTLYSRTSSIFGIGQTIQNKTSERSFESTYFNTSGKTIYVHISCYSYSGVLLRSLVDNIVVGHQYVDTSNTGGLIRNTFSFPVPNNSSYKLTKISGSGASAIEYWSELR